jgi:biopolymer transport protein ExbD
MDFERKTKLGTQIPLASMSDIAFLLLIFFMVTTIFKLEDGLPVELPRAISAEKQKRELIAHVWIDAEGRISINDKLVETNQINDIIRAKLLENPNLIVAFNTDHRTPYQIVWDVMEELKEAEAVRVSFTSAPESGG